MNPRSGKEAIVRKADGSEHAPSAGQNARAGEAGHRPSRIVPLRQEVVRDTGRNRVLSQPAAHLYDKECIDSAVNEVLGRLSPDALPGDRLEEASGLLLGYSYEWLEPRKDGVYVARSREIPGAVGCGSGADGRMAALTSAVESHVEFLVAMIAAGQPLPSLASGGSLAERRPQRKKMIAIRLTPEEYSALSDAADIQSMNVSEFVREMAVYRSTAPAETI